MGISQPNLTPVLLQRLRSAGAFKDDPLSLIDVGCSGGLGVHWHQFPLRALGIDPMVAEVERLNQAEKDGSVKFIEGTVRLPDFPPKSEREAGSDEYFFGKSSAYDIVKRSPAPVNDWSTKQLTENELTLDGAAAILGGRVDFVKTDTDGNDIEVLHSGVETLGTAVGVYTETIISGGTHPLSNSRSNIDRFLRQQGFSLFDEETHRYSRACLPDRFTWGAPVMTNRGQVIWSDCLYFRDLATFGKDWPDVAFLKLAGLYEVYNLNDCAAELILSRPSAFEPFIKPTEALDLLTSEWWQGEHKTHEGLLEAFAKDYEDFYPEIYRRKKS